MGYLSKILIGALLFCPLKLFLCWQFYLRPGFAAAVAVVAFAATDSVAGAVLLSNRCSLEHFKLK